MPEDQRTPAADELSDLAARGAAMAPDERLAVLGAGRVELIGRMPWSSNATFVVVCQLDGMALPAIYKPEGGERPLWDFPTGIFRREVATYELSERLGLSIVPETIARHDAPFGVGSMQRFVPADFAQHYFTLLDDEAAHDRLRELAAFDVLCNNADRKGGHVLAQADGTMWAIDNGLTFHVEPKLRTVIWDFAGDPVPPAVRAELARLADAPGLGDLLDGDECAALATRARRLDRAGRLPHPDQRRHHMPWPLV